MQNDSIFLSEVKDFFHEIHPILSAKVMEIYNSKDFFIDEKKDGSPVTQADLVVNDILREKLTNKFPDIYQFCLKKIPTQKKFLVFFGLSTL